MSAIGPGDWIECLFPNRTGELSAGRIYCVEAIAEVVDHRECCRCGNGARGPRVALFLADGPNDEVGWCPCRFRPVYRPRADLIEQLKQPSPEREREDA